MLRKDNFSRIKYLISLIFIQVRPRSPHHSVAHSGIPVGHFAHQNTQTTPNQSARKAEPYFCDRTLLQSLVRDAIVTDGLDSKNTMHTTRKEDKQ